MEADYDMLRHLASGGMAEVVLAEHKRLKTRHALKILRVQSEDFRRRLLREGRYQATLHHENIVPVTDVFHLEDGTPTLVMDFIEGPSLDRLLDVPPLTIGQIDSLGRGILRGVVAAHAHKLVHRDLKPENILLAVEGGRLVPKVADFGLAKALHDALGESGTKTGMLMGTPGHMAPEQFRDAKRVDERADIFALGTILYQILCRRRCFDEDGVLQTYSMAMDGTYPRVRTLVRDAPDRMVRAIDLALMPDLNDRPQSTSELLELWEDGTPEEERPFSESTLAQLLALPGLPQEDSLAPDSLTDSIGATTDALLDLKNPALLENLAQEGPAPPEPTRSQAGWWRAVTTFWPFRS